MSNSNQGPESPDIFEFCTQMGFVFEELSSPSRLPASTRHPPPATPRFLVTRRNEAGPPLVFLVPEPREAP